MIRVLLSFDVVSIEGGGYIKPDDITYILKMGTHNP